VESTFTIGFLNDLILITATADQNFSAIDQGVTFPYISGRPIDRPDFGAARRAAGASRDGPEAMNRQDVRSPAAHS
jgi:hypothetical protein